jgi:hypothetical protein
MNVWVDEHHGFATIQLLHELFKLRIPEETISHAAHEHEPVTLQLAECNNSSWAAKAAN